MLNQILCGGAPWYSRSVTQKKMVASFKVEVTVRDQLFIKKKKKNWKSKSPWGITFSIVPYPVNIVWNMESFAANLFIVLHYHDLERHVKDCLFTFKMKVTERFRSWEKQQQQQQQQLFTAWLMSTWTVWTQTVCDVFYDKPM